MFQVRARLSLHRPIRWLDDGEVIMQLQPEPVAVIVTLPAVSPAVKVTFVLLPELGFRVPLPLVIAHVAGPGFTVSSTSSPTPILVRARFNGEVAIVSDVMVQEPEGVAQDWVGEVAEPPGFGPELGLEGSLRQLMLSRPRQNTSARDRARSWLSFPNGWLGLRDLRWCDRQACLLSRDREDHRSTHGQS